MGTIARYMTAALFAVALVFGVAGVVEAQGPYPCTGTLFNDVDAGTVGEAFCGYIEHFAALGITSGCAVAPPLYCPAEPVTRAHMAVFVTRALDQTASGDITAVNPGFGLTGGGTSGAVTLGVDTGAVQARVTGSCPTGQSIRAIDPAGAVTCQADANSGGTVTSVASGFGLSGGPITAAGTLAVDTAMIQRRVLGSCDAGSSIRVIAGDGSVTCEPDTDSGGTVTSIDTGAGLAGGPITTSGTLAVSFAGPGAATTVARSDHTHAVNVSTNTAVGAGGPLSAATGVHNTAVGSTALAANTTGGFNTTMGSRALESNTEGGGNTAVGQGALQENTTGSNNVAVGASAMVQNTTGQLNTATGTSALANNTTGDDNTAVGANALFSSTTGTRNSALGESALFNTTIGHSNTAVGAGALVDNTTGIANVALGVSALRKNTTGIGNVALGASALSNNTTGNGNTAIGDGAGLNATSLSSNNIYIAHLGQGGESGSIRLGGPNQTRAFVVGIRGVTTGVADAVPVLIDSNGQLGTLSSSRRYKQEVQGMGDGSAGLLRLRPVTFRYRQPQANARREYGLIAEEVAEVYPDLVVHSATGEVETVQYHKLVPLLLNELQRQAAEIAGLRRDQAALRLDVAQLTEVLAHLARFEAAVSPTGH